MTGDEALLFLGDVRNRVSVVSLNAEEYARAIEEAASLGIVDGGIYDALLGACALKAKAGTIYTWNVKHFERLGSRDQEARENPLKANHETVPKLCLTLSAHCAASAS